MAQNALELLKEDHEKVKHLLDELSHTDSRAEKKRTELIEKISEELRIHTKIEEEIFYPAFRAAGNKEEKVMFHEATEEHRAVEELILPDLEGTPVTTDAFSGRAKVLKEMIEHHVTEEEEEMFVKAKELLSESELQELGARMQEMKSSLSASAH